jgi:hypothetical protein
MRLNLSLPHIHTHTSRCFSRTASVSVKYVLRGVCSYSLFFISIVLCWSVCLHPARPGVILGEANWGPSSAHTVSHTEHKCKHNPLRLKLSEFELEGADINLMRDRESHALGSDWCQRRTGKDCKIVEQYVLNEMVLQNLFYSHCP